MTFLFIMETIDDFIRSEELKMTWLDKAFMNYPEVRLTSILASLCPNSSFKEETVIKPSLLNKFIAIIIVPFLALVWIGLLNMLLQYKFPFAIVLFGFLLVTFIIFLLLKDSFFNRKLVYTIILTDSYISICNRKFSWANVSETAILTRREGKRRNSYLIVITNNNAIEQFDLYSFGISDKKLSAHIEYYKTKNKSR